MEAHFVLVVTLEVTPIQLAVPLTSLVCNARQALFHLDRGLVSAGIVLLVNMQTKQAVHFAIHVFQEHIRTLQDIPRAVCVQQALSVQIMDYQYALTVQ
jgi:hypothetical protein